MYPQQPAPPPNSQYGGYPPQPGYAQPGYAQPPNGYQQQGYAPVNPPAPPQDYGSGGYTPLNGEGGQEIVAPPGHQEITLDKPKCRDIPCAFLFVAQFIAALVVGGIYISDATASQSGSQSLMDHIRPILIALAFIVPLTAVASCFGLMFLQKCGKQIIWASYLLSALAMVCLGTFIVIQDQDVDARPAAVGPFFFALIFLLAPFCLRRRIRFTASILKGSIAAIRKYPSTIIVSLVISLIAAGWAIFAVWTWISLTDNDNTKEYPGTILAFMIIAFFWTVETLRNISHTITAGVVGTYWFDPEPRNVVISSTKRATTYSLGSVAFGSLLVTLITLLRMVLKAKMRRSRNLVELLFFCILACLSAIIERFLRWFNTYAYTYIALYGTSYLESAGRTMDLLSARGITALINEDLSEMAIFLVQTFIVCLICVPVAIISFSSSDVEYRQQTVTLSVFVAISIVICVFQAVKSAVATTFVCYAEDPEAMKATRPAEYDNIIEAQSKHILPPEPRQQYSDDQ